MKILFVTDLHGSQWKYDRLLEAAQNYGAHVVINGGDMLPKNADLYKQGEFISHYLDDHFAQFNSAEIYYLCYLGNDDLRIFDQLFEVTCDKYQFVSQFAQRKVDIEDYHFIGMNWVVDYPFRLKDRCRMDTDDYVFQGQLGSGLLSTPKGWKEIDDWFAYAKSLPTLEEELWQLPNPENMAKSIYVIHMPPSGLGLCKHYGNVEVGSEAVYNFLAKRQPALSLHGHIHEAPEVTGKWYANLGKTLCIQPGQLDELTYVTIDLSIMEPERIREKHELHTLSPEV